VRHLRVVVIVIAMFAVIVALGAVRLNGVLFGMCGRDSHTWATEHIPHARAKNDYREREDGREQD
jgi:hypothetical protein